MGSGLFGRDSRAGLRPSAFSAFLGTKLQLQINKNGSKKMFRRMSFDWNGISSYISGPQPTFWLLLVCGQNTIGPSQCPVRVFARNINFVDTIEWDSVRRLHPASLSENFLNKYWAYLTRMFSSFPDHVREFSCGKLYYRTFHMNEDRDVLYVGAM